MSAQPLSLSLYADIAQGKRCWVDANTRAPLTAADLLLYRGDKTIIVTLYDNGVAATMTGKTQANYALILKDPAALNGTTLLASTGAAGGSVTLAGNVLTCTMPTNTAAINTWLAAATRKAARLELVHVTSGTEDAGPLASADVTVIADANRGNESTPAAAGNGLLPALAALTLVANTIVEITSTAGAVALRTITTFGKSLLAANDAAAGRTALGVDAAGTAQGLITSHTHAGAGNGPKLAQANTHESADTDAAPGSIHHSVGPGANQAAAGNHAHSGTYEPANANIQAHVTGTGSPHTAAGVGADPAGTAANAVGALSALVSSSGGTTIDVAVREQRWTMTASFVVTATVNGAASQVRRATIMLVASGGTRTVTLPAAWVWPSGNKPASDVISLATGETGQLVVEDVDNSATVRCFYAKDET